MNHKEIKSVIIKSRESIKYTQDSVVIRQDHFNRGGKKSIALKSLNTGADTLIQIENFHDEVRAMLKVSRPEGYLIRSDDEVLINWLEQSKIEFVSAENLNLKNIYSYHLNRINSSIDEELNNKFPEIRKVKIERIKSEDYIFVNMDQIAAHLIAISLEPQSLFGLVQYDRFQYLLNEKVFPILRVE
jgi:hypothetical protein